MSPASNIQPEPINNEELASIRRRLEDALHDYGYKSFSPEKAFEDGYAIVENNPQTVAGHLYHLKNFEDATSFQVLQFIHKEPITPGAATLKTISDGTTNEEVLAVLIDRLQYLNSKFPCKENAVALTHIETALLWLNKRTADRKARGVEGTHQK